LSDKTTNSSKLCHSQNKQSLVQMSIAENIKLINSQLLGSRARLVVVSKTYPPEVVMEAYEAGSRIFGENRVQELVPKYEALPKDIEWHLIGHLQSNKVKYIAPFVAMIHSVDSFRLLDEINKQAQKANRTIDCLLQIHVALEETKFGFSPEEATQLLASGQVGALTNVRIKGLMGMATFTSDVTQIRAEFRQLKQLFDTLKASYQAPNLDFCELSMGMSSDFGIAIEEGSTLVRVGSSIFGHRG
jgi:PLP dependent protein